jgi:ribosomal protein S18 acetylase RimI-like enzyme
VNVEAPAYAAFPLLHHTVSIRPLEERDLLSLEWQGGQDLRGFYEELWQAHHAGEIHVLVADFNGFPIGLANIHWPGKPTQPEMPDVQSLRVHPIFRGQKIGSQLLQTCEQLIAARGFATVTLSVALENTRAKKLYERHGYHVAGPPYCDVWYYTDAQGRSVGVEEHIIDMVKKL